MKVQDLGRLEGDVLLFGGPYSNFQATQALIAEAKRRGIGPGNMICTGDVVAYCADAALTVAEIRSLGCAVVAGNCERQLGENALDCGCGFEDGTVCDVLSARWYAHANAEIGAHDRTWMRDLPDIVVFEHNNNRVAVIHGGVTDISRFIWSVSPLTAFKEELDFLRLQIGDFDIVVAGHSGIAFVREIEGVKWVNAGAIGLPPHDGGMMTRFAVLQADSIQIQDLEYDADAANLAMESKGLTQGYHTTLLSGIWPSEDVLPVDLRREK